MITDYHRPETIEEALDLLSRTEVDTVPLGGGSTFGNPLQKPVEVVDLQSLGLNSLGQKGKKLQIGATVTLQQLLDFNIEPALKVAIRHEATYNQRQTATVAGTLMTADGRSPFAAAMLALDADLKIFPGEEIHSLGNYLPLRADREANQLIGEFSVPSHVKLGYEYVARTPADLPIVCVAVAQWQSGRTRVVLGGFGNSPLLAMDGPSSDGAADAAKNAYQEAGDQWASAEYRAAIAPKLVARALTSISLKMD